MSKIKTIEFTDYEWEIVHEGSTQINTAKILYLFPILTLHAEDWNALEDKNASWITKLRFLIDKKYIRATPETTSSIPTLVFEKAPLNATLLLYHQYSNFFLQLDLSLLKENPSS